jgi:hypothetical protein
MTKNMQNMTKNMQNMTKNMHNNMKNTTKKMFKYAQYVIWYINTTYFAYPTYFNMSNMSKIDPNVFFYILFYTLVYILLHIICIFCILQYVQYVQDRPLHIILHINLHIVHIYAI